MAVVRSAEYTQFLSKGFFLTDARGRYGGAHAFLAEKYLSQELQNFEKILGQNHWQVFGLKVHLMDVLCVCKRVNDAMDISKQLKASTEMFSASNVQRISAEQILAGFYKLQNNWVEAEDLLRGSKSALETELGPMHLMTIRTWKFLADLYINWGKFDRAENELKQLVPFAQRSLHGDHHLTYQIVNSYADVLEHQNKVEAAQEMRALQQGKGDETNQGILMALGDEYERGCSARVDRRFDEAEKILSRVMLESEKLTRQSRGTRRNQCTDLYDMATKGLALTLFGQDKLKEAENLQRDLLARMIARNHPLDDARLDIMDDLAFTLECEKKLYEAEKLQLEVRKGRADVLGPVHEKTTSSRKRLAAIFRAQGRNSEAESEYKAIIDACEQRLGLYHIQTLKEAKALASFYRGIPRGLKLADEAFIKAIEISRNVLGAYSEETLDLADERAAVLELDGRVEEAEELLEYTKRDLLRYFGPDHEATKNVIEHLEDIKSGN
ncbi:hypothetical protein FOZG_17399 [Fusarium oxysporum Fo47]|uniref:MalT-like TPR region domain-containing protein n=2 Tax=Fusarium oxysporum Fo47 TaxID=660027 RepID=W9JAS5_FUSOX|nr:hypothetical protein FOZG_17399 [Fusarium oxysporum Fo47]